MCIGISNGKPLQVNSATKIVLIIKEKKIPSIVGPHQVSAFVARAYHIMAQHFTPLLHHCAKEKRLRVQIEVKRFNSGI